MVFCNFVKKEINVLLLNFKLKLLYKVESLIILFCRKDKIGFMCYIYILYYVNVVYVIL